MRLFDRCADTFQLNTKLFFIINLKCAFLDCTSRHLFPSPYECWTSTLQNIKFRRKKNLKRQFCSCFSRILQSKSIETFLYIYAIKCIYCKKNTCNEQIKSAIAIMQQNLKRDQQSKRKCIIKKQCCAVFTRNWCIISNPKSAAISNHKCALAAPEQLVIYK